MGGGWACASPEQFDEGGYAARLEDGQQPLAVVREVVERAGGAAGRLHVVRVVHRAHQGGHHLRRVHDGVPACLLLRQLVDHHRRLADDHLVLVVEQLRQLRDGARREVSVVLRQGRGQQRATMGSTEGDGGGQQRGRYGQRRATTTRSATATQSIVVIIIFIRSQSPHDNLIINIYY